MTVFSFAKMSERSAWDKGKGKAPSLNVRGSPTSASCRIAAHKGVLCRDPCISTSFVDVDPEKREHNRKDVPDSEYTRRISSLHLCRNVLQQENATEPIYVCSDSMRHNTVIPSNGICAKRRMILKTSAGKLPQVECSINVVGPPTSASCTTKLKTVETPKEAAEDSDFLTGDEGDTQDLEGYVVHPQDKVKVKAAESDYTTADEQDTPRRYFNKQNGETHCFVTETDTFENTSCDVSLKCNKLISQSSHMRINQGGAEWAFREKAPSILMKEQHLAPVLNEEFQSMDYLNVGNKQSHTRISTKSSKERRRHSRHDLNSGTNSIRQLVDECLNSQPIKRANNMSGVNLHYLQCAATETEEVDMTKAKAIRMSPDDISLPLVNVDCLSPRFAGHSHAWNQRCSNCGQNCYEGMPMESEEIKKARMKSFLARAIATCEEELSPLHDTLQLLHRKVQALELPELSGQDWRAGVGPGTGTGAEVGSHSSSSLRRAASESNALLANRSFGRVRNVADVGHAVPCEHCGLELVPESDLSPLAKMYILLSKKIGTESNTDLCHHS